MKRLIFIISILLIAEFIHGQGNPNLVIDTGYFGKYITPNNFWGRTYPDTLRIIYIGMDTARTKYPGANSLRQSNGDIVQYPDADTHRIIWMIWALGYIVYTEKETYFLGENKKPICEPFFIFDYRIIDKRKRPF